MYHFEYYHPTMLVASHSSEKPLHSTIPWFDIFPEWRRTDLASNSATMNSNHFKILILIIE